MLQRLTARGKRKLIEMRERRAIRAMQSKVNSMSTSIDLKPDLRIVAWSVPGDRHGIEHACLTPCFDAPDRQHPLGPSMCMSLLLGS